MIMISFVRKTGRAIITRVSCNIHAMAGDWQWQKRLASGIVTGSPALNPGSLATRPRVGPTICSINGLLSYIHTAKYHQAYSNMSRSLPDIYRKPYWVPGGWEVSIEGRTRHEYGKRIITGCSYFMHTVNMIRWTRGSVYPNEGGVA